MKVYLAADHAGFPLKEELKKVLLTKPGLEIEDCGAISFDKDDDYPLFVHVAASKLANDGEKGIESRAIVIGASGQGEAIVANRHTGVRCALYYGPAPTTQIDVAGKQLDMLSSTREHNDANALSLGARFLDANEAIRTVLDWLKKPFSGEERHERRIKEIDA